MFGDAVTERSEALKALLKTAIEGDTVKGVDMTPSQRPGIGVRSIRYVLLFLQLWKQNTRDLLAAKFGALWIKAAFMQPLGIFQRG